MRAPAQLTTIPLLTHFARPSPRADALDDLRAILRDGVIGGSSRIVAGQEHIVGLFDALCAELFGPAR